MTIGSHSGNPGRRGRCYGLGMKIAPSPFARNYQEARSHFVAWKEAVPGAIHDKVSVANAAGKDLSVDILTLPAQQKAENVLVISSGVHGAEGAPGSAMQELFLKEHLPSLDRSKTTVVLVHAVNPWGFENNHRYTENNVDLNRNSVKDAETFKNYPNKLYKNVQGLLTASKPPRWYAASQARMGFGLVFHLVKSGFKRGEVTQSVAGGQNVDPRGVNFASDRHEAQIPAIQQILRQHIGGAKNVVHYDIHTGLGARGHLHVIDNSDPQSVEASKAYISPLTSNPSDTIWHNTSNDPGFYDVSLGDFTNVSESAAAPGANVFTYTAEVGTLGKGLLQQIDSAARYHERNSLGFYADKLSDKKKAAILERCTEMYNPADESWQQQTTENFRKLFDHTVKSFNQGLGGE
jgi:hypothetical protein